MAISLASLKKTAPTPWPLTLIYGVEKVGKTALAAEWPKAVLARTPGENTPEGVEIDSWEIATLNELFDAIEALITDDHGFESFIVDAVDGLHRMVNAEACKRNNWQSIEDPGFGKGHIEAEGIWVNEVLPAFAALRDIKKMKVVLISHVEISKFDDPANGSYSKYRPNVRLKVAELIQSAADIIAFVNHRVSLVQEDAGFNKKTTRGAGGGIRVIYLQERPSYIAGSRYNHPPEIIYKKGSGYAELAKNIPAAA